MANIKIMYIEKNIDTLDHKQKQTLLHYIAKYGRVCLKESSDGTRINLNTINVNLLENLYLFIRNQVEYNTFFKDSLEITS